MIHRGGCHCGNLRYALETALALDALPLRECQCSFCRHHGARSTSDPQGSLRFEVDEPRRVTRYRFGLKTADFLICATCGVYVGATLEDGGARWAIVNANTLDAAASLRPAGMKMDYDGEDATARALRRKSRWTPVAPDGT